MRDKQENLLQFLDIHCQNKNIEENLLYSSFS